MSATILVVEDDAIAAESIRDVLVAAGYSVPETAPSGAAALDAALRLRPELVLMDIQLDGLIDGVETASRLRAQADVPVVYLTAAADDATLARARATRPHGYLQKPFSARELRVAVEIALHQHGRERELARREQWFSTTLRSIADAVLTTDHEGRITFVNAAAERLLRVPACRLLRQACHDVVQLSDGLGAPLPLLMQRAIGERAAVPLSGGARLVPSEGEGDPVEVEGSVSAIVAEGAEPLGAVMVLRDVGQRRKLERRLAVTEKLAALGTVAAGMQHEINNPLAYVIANVHFALDALRSRPDAADLGDIVAALEDASEGAERMRRTVDELKPFAHAEEGTKRRLDLAEVLDTAARTTAHAVRHHATLRRDFGPAPRVLADESLLTRAFATLLLHAAQAMGDGRAEENVLVLATSTDADGRAVVEIRDSGRRLAPREAEALFDPYSPLGEPGSARLGLAVAHGIVTAAGGEVDVLVAADAGTTYRIALPRAPETPRPPHRSTRPPPASAPTRRGRVLVIDDEVAIGKAIGRILGREHSVTTETDARAALARLRAGEAFDIIFCDLMMPNMSGMEFFDALREMSAELAGSVVFLTGGAFSSRSAEFLRTIRNQCLPKPFSRDAVSAVLRERLPS